MTDLDSLLGRVDDLLTAEENANQAERGNQALRARAPELVLDLHRAGHLGYLAASDEWVNNHGYPLILPLQEAAHALAVDGHLPEFAEWFPAPTFEECPPRQPEPPQVRSRPRPQPSWWRRLFRRV